MEGLIREYVVIALEYFRGTVQLMVIEDHQHDSKK